MWVGTFTHTCTAPWGMVVGTCHLQGRQPLPWGRSPVSFEQIIQTSFFSRWLLTWFGTFTRTCTAPWQMVVVTCHLQGRQPLPCGRSLVSFGQIGLGVVFRGRVETRVLPALPCPGWCIIHGRWFQMWFGTFTHTCTAHWGMVAGTCHLQGRQPLPWGRSSVSFEQIGPPSFFSQWL